MIEAKEFVFTLNGKRMLPTSEEKTNCIPFKNHERFQLVMDILSRKNNHHAILQLDFPQKLHTYFVNALLDYFSQDHIPFHLRHTKVYYLDIENLPIENGDIKNTVQTKIEENFQQFCENLHSSEKYTLFLLSHYHFITSYTKHAGSYFLQAQLKTLLSHPKCRFIILTQENLLKHHADLAHQFTFISMGSLTTADITCLLKQECTSLENFHHVIIPDDILTHAYSLAERYLCCTNALEKCLELLDSSAANLRTTEHADNGNKPILSLNTLLKVLSNWTRIPANHLQLDQFKLNEFLQTLQQKVFGQEKALTLIGQALLQKHAQIQSTHLCNSLLFVGPPHSGKETAAIALADTLFQQFDCLFFAKPSFLHMPSIFDLKFERYSDKKYLSLKEVLWQTPYAILMFENVERFPSCFLDALQEILSTGQLMKDDISFHFSHTLLLFSTTQGTKYLSKLSHFLPDDNETSEHIDLLQLISNEKKHNPAEIRLDTPEELIKEIINEINSLPISFISTYANIIPFLPAQLSTVEKIIISKLKNLEKTLDARYGIDFAYAPEVIRFLANAAHKHELTTGIDTALKQLYHSVEQSLLTRPTNKNNSLQLFLHLNETGQLLHCDWLAITPVRQHST